MGPVSKRASHHVEAAPETPTPVVVLAGGKAKPDLAAFTGQTTRALVEVLGKTLLRHVIDALAGAESVGPIVVIGEVPESSDYSRLPDSGAFVANLYSGISGLADSPFVLIATSDLPFITAEVVDHFVRGGIELANRTDAGIVYPVVPVAACYARYPGVKRTALRLKEGEFTGGNLMLCRPRILLAHEARIADAYAARKSPVRLARMLGFGTLGRLVASQKISPNLLSISMLEARVTRLLGCSAVAYVSEYPEIATDLDRPSDFAALNLTAATPPR